MLVQFRPIVDAEFVKHNLWPELVPELRSVIQDSDLVNSNGNSTWKTINALIVLQSVIRPFQVSVKSVILTTFLLNILCIYL